MEHRSEDSRLQGQKLDICSAENSMLDEKQRVQSYPEGK